MNSAIVIPWPPPNRATRKERKVNRYLMEVVTQVITIEAPTEEEAELKYDAYFNGEDCPCGEEVCDCVEDSEDCYHNTSLVKEDI
jgi:hypothetical protein